MFLFRRCYIHTFSEKCTGSFTPVSSGCGKGGSLGLCRLHDSEKSETSDPKTIK